MIRKGLITVLSLAAMAALTSSIVSDPSRWHAWQVDSERSIGIQLSTREFGAIYSTVGDPAKADIRSAWMGFGFVRGRMYSQPNNLYSSTVYGVFCASWVVVVLLGTYPTLAFVRGPLRRWRRRRQGRCQKCGYDLAGNVTGVCPECGTARTASVR